MYYWLSEWDVFHRHPIMGHLGQTWLAQLHQHLPRPFLIYRNANHQQTLDYLYYVNNLPSIMPTGKQCRIPFQVSMLPSKEDILQSSPKILRCLQTGRPFKFKLYNWHSQQKLGKHDQNRLDGGLRALQHQDYDISYVQD